MKKLILAVFVMAISSVSVADSVIDRTFANSIGAMEGISYIRDNLPGTYSHIYNEWVQTSINRTTSIEANKRSQANALAIENLTSELDTAIDDLNAGIAGAMAAASLPFASSGKNSFMVGAGIYNGESALAFGISGNSGDGKVIKFSFTADTAGNSGASAGASFEF